MSTPEPIVNGRQFAVALRCEAVRDGWYKLLGYRYMKTPKRQIPAGSSPDGPVIGIVCAIPFVVEYEDGTLSVTSEENDGEHRVSLPHPAHPRLTAASNVRFRVRDQPPVNSSTYDPGMSFICCCLLQKQPAVTYAYPASIYFEYAVPSSTSLLTAGRPADSTQ